MKKTHSHASPFFALTPEVRDVLLDAKLTAAEWRFWCYLVSLDPFGDRGAKFSPAEAMLKCQLKKTTYFAAKVKFQKLGLFDFKDGTTKVINTWGSKRQSEIPESESEIPESESEIPESESEIPESESEIPESESEIPELKDAKCRLGKDYSGSQTIHSSFRSFSSATANSAAAEEEKRIPREEHQKWISDICLQLRQIRINPQDVLWAVKKFPAPVVEDAIAYTKEQRWADKPAAVFVAACREGKKLEPAPPVPGVPVPTIEQLAQLEEIKERGAIRSFYSQPWGGGEAVVVDDFKSIRPWWEVLTHLGDEP